MNSFIYHVEAPDGKAYWDGLPYDGLPCYDCTFCGKRYRLMIAARGCCMTKKLNPMIFFCENYRE